jgi:hypothetical protein
MFQDHTLTNGRKFRVFWEDISICHPEAPAGLIYDLTGHKRLYEYSALPSEMVEDVKSRVLSELEALESGANR